MKLNISRCYIRCDRLEAKDVFVKFGHFWPFFGCFWPFLADLLAVNVIGGY